ncbi:hypothetical protein ACSW8S_16755 (plasmid) [Clostridium perfringens]
MKKVDNGILEKIYYIDNELSKKIYDEFEYFIKPKECFTNVGYVCEIIKDDPKFKDIEVVYGAWEVENIQSNTKLFCRHCFLLLDDKVVDPTFFTTTTKKNPKYISIKKFSIKEYSKAIEESDLNTSLNSYVENAYREAHTYLLSNNILLVG